MQHTSRAFEEELHELSAKVSSMGTEAERLLRDGVSALLEGNATLAGEVIAADRQLDLIQREAETLAVGMIARRQPMADDLRRIVGIMRMVADIERVGDLAKGIAKRAALIGLPVDRRVVSTGIQALYSAALAQFAAVLVTFRDDDAEAAERVRLADEKIDTLYNALVRELLTYMMEDSQAITLATHLLFCAKNLERVGDHATNIAETILYVVTGDDPPIDRPRSETAATEG